MRRWDLRHNVISSCVTAALLASCGGSQLPMGTPGAMPQALAIAPARTGVNRMTTSSYRVVHRFPYTHDGARPALASLRTARRRYCIVSAPVPTTPELA
jgi:hypothetical protein